MGVVQHCTVCSYACPTIQGMSWHRFDVHGLKDPLRDMVLGVTCACCLRYYHSRERLVRHLAQTSSRCALFYFQSVGPQNPEAVKAEEDEAKVVSKRLAKAGKRRVHAEAPPHRVLGPLAHDAVKLGIDYEYGLGRVPKKVIAARAKAQSAPCH